MKSTWTFALRLIVLTLLACWWRPASAVEPTPAIASISQPVGGEMQVLFHGGNGPFLVQMRTSLDVNSPWLDIPSAKVTQVNTGVFLAYIPVGNADAAFYRVVSAGETIVELKGWTIQTSVSAPANGTHFVAGEAPVVTVKLLDNSAAGITKSSLSALALYMYGPEDPSKTVTASKLLNASTNRSASVHHYIDLRSASGVTMNGNTFTYPLKPVTTEAPGTYTIAVRSALTADGMQQVVKYATIQIGTSTVEAKVISTAKCAECHQGTVSGKLYMHHADVSSRSAFGSWIYDLEPDKSCKMCHNNDGYASFTNTNAPGGRVPDHIVIRAHGVHMGEGLKLPFNVNPENGNFHDYTHVVFPADVRNCTACHVDDRWKTKPARLACGACHDNTWFGPDPTPAGWLPHIGGPQANDQFCSFCHSPDTGSFSPISVAHAVPPPTAEFAVEMTMSAPASGTHFVDGEAPTVTLKFKSIATGQYIDPATMTSWSRARFAVAGPRSGTTPVLTTAALDHSKSGSTSYIYNDLRNAANDPRVTLTADSIIYQLDTITNLTAGTYSAYVQARQGSSGDVSLNLINFQVATATVEPNPAGSCTDCHGDTKIHGSYPYTLAPDLCKMCHDYEHQLTGKTAWTGSGQSQYGFGVSPISRRVHGIHFGNYVEKPNEIQSQDFSHVIFPMDVRNCTKCHSESPSWKEKPSRLACFACHDSDSALLHGTSMTLDPTPADPWSGDEVETCAVCHGKGKSFAPSTVHSINNPYVPPYPRALRESEPYVTANVARGGQLYDKWWTVKGLAAPVGNHPLWATRPDTTSNTRTGPDTWRCKECHGWDYKGVNGAYGTGSHRTGIVGIFGTTKTAQEVFDLLKTGHGFGATGLSDWDIWDVTKFVREGQIDTATVIDANKKFTGNAATGQTLYDNGVGSKVSCSFCHGANGLTPPAGYPSFTLYPGFLSDDNPWEFLHKVRFGHPGSAMPGAVAGGATVQNVSDVSTYSQTLPAAP